MTSATLHRGLRRTGQSLVAALAAVLLLAAPSQAATHTFTGVLDPTLTVGPWVQQSGTTTLAVTCHNNVGSRYRVALYQGSTLVSSGLRTCGTFGTTVVESWDLKAGTYRVDLSALYTVTATPTKVSGTLTYPGGFTPNAAHAG